MIDDSVIRRELEDVPVEERDDLVNLGGRLIGSRPAPRAAFRAELRQQLRLGESLATRPVKLRVLIASYAGSGLLLLAVAAVGLAGLGPFAA